MTTTVHLAAVPLCACGCTGAVLAFFVKPDGSITERLLDLVPYQTAREAIGYLVRESPVIDFTVYPVAHHWPSMRSS